LASLFVWVGASSAAPLDFNRDVRPVLSDKCFACHGPDEAKRKAKLRLDRPEQAFKALEKSGKVPLVPAHPEQSEVYRRITTNDSTDRMPPPESGKTLTTAQVELLRQWIEQGAVYQEHWAFVAPKQAPLPVVKHTDWPLNPIDYFILARLEAAGLGPSPAADPYTLIRRLYFDLIGLPPMPEEAEAFAANPSPQAYLAVVEDLLSSPHYGERWARRWLDIARYADTNGYEKDRPRTVWPYRDWVINALNADLPFDRFTIEQIAGDLLPGATLNQRVATGFHRNTMLNEEGGIDPLEFRFHAMTDRVLTTGETWLGLTIGCAQCHTHKYDPITQREYYQFMAFLDNADEPTIDIPKAEITAKREKLEARIAKLIDELPNKFPVETMQWQTPKPVRATAKGEGTMANIQDDQSILFEGPTPETDSYSIELEWKSDQPVTQLRVETLADDRLPSRGPGRTPHGNFVLTEVEVLAGPLGKEANYSQVGLESAEADFAQDGLPAAAAIDGKKETGWAIHGPGKWNVTRTITFKLKQPIQAQERSAIIVRLHQDYGGKHLIGRVRIGLGSPVPDPRSIEVRRKEKLEATFQEWLQREIARTVSWSVLKPVKASANLPLLTVLEDQSILASGDMSKRDVYQIDVATDLEKVTALRLEVLADDRLPAHGPGRVFYEGAFGDFFLSEVTAQANGQPIALTNASHSFAGGGSAGAAIDGDPQTGWSISGGQGRSHTAVFNLSQPLTQKNFSVQLLFERYFAAGLGRFRLAATSEARPAQARDLPPDLDVVLLTPAEQRTTSQQEALFREFLQVTPELAPARAEIGKLREQMPAFPTTLVMAERPAENPRATFVHKRGEFLQPTDRVEPGVPAALHSFPSDQARNRLTFAQWLVATNNPLVARVTVNRQWAALFGQGLVRTPRDFGFQGQAPTHPELLDWLAVEFMREGGSLKKLHKMIVTSATYRQSSRTTPALLAQDPENRLLGRRPQVRLEAEFIRDALLSYSGLLSPKVGGPSVFPPQAANITTEGAYGQLKWTPSEGADRYRRGLYTFTKRTAPYAMFSTFDGPSGEACVIQREVSNTPLQALSLLNDMVVVDAARAVGRNMVNTPGPLPDRVRLLFRRVLTRPPSEPETKQLVEFFQTEQARFAKKEFDATEVAGEGSGDAAERAAWTALARILFNLDEAITKS
jgi:hypothetical protein